VTGCGRRIKRSRPRDYNWEALQAVMAQAVMHARRGKDPWSLSDQAIRRSFLWLYRRAALPRHGSDGGDEAYWLPASPTGLRARARRARDHQARPAVGFADWTTLDPSWP
jgi:hypothetical protein